MTSQRNDSQGPSTGQNRLAGEKSPYLLQHADNPVDWYPWGEEAFETARREDKPIFLSIGYSTCHWCHVMEHESFEDSAVAALMNDAFVNVKVDREERPDIDNVYMMVSQMMTGSGGWPLTVVMTPDRRPFFVATYLPRETRHGRIGMVELIPQIKTAWQTRRTEVLEASTQITGRLRHLFDRMPGEHGLDGGTLSSAYDQLAQRFDTANGGFSNAPKFPTPHNLLFLLRYWKRTGSEHALEMVETTLERMARGGIYDHVGFGFHRYSTDHRWFAPHFEKMLYDQALLIMAYTEGYLATGKDTYRRTAEQVIQYVLRDMTDPQGGFYSAEDADSEGVEGKFYLWAEQELVELLGSDDGRFVADLYGVETSGNFSGEIKDANILFLRRPTNAVARELGVSESELEERLDKIRATLFAQREKRTHPYKDDKILTDWNGLMIAALAKAARAFDEATYKNKAEKAVKFILGNLRDDEGRLLHRYRDGEAGIQANLDDYAFLIWGLIELYEATFDVEHLRVTLDLNEIAGHDFWDDDRGGFFFSSRDGEKMITSVKEVYDGAVPSGNSVATLNLLRLGRMTANPEHEDRAERIGRVFYEDVTKSPSAFTLLMTALDFGVGPSRELIIVGDISSEDTRAMRRAVDETYNPSMVLVFKPSGETNPEISSIAKFTAVYEAIDGKATAYVCSNYACKLPTTDIDAMLRLVDEGSDQPGRGR